MFAVIRALVMAGTVALAFGLDLSHGYWLPIAAMVAMKPSLEQATLVAAQRVAGALIGAAAAALLWTLCGVGIGVLVMLLAGLLAKRTAKAPPGRPADVPAQRKTTAEQDLASPSGHRAEPGMPGGA